MKMNAKLSEKHVFDRMRAIAAVIIVLAFLSSCAVAERNDPKISGGLAARLKAAAADEKIPLIVVLDESDGNLAEVKSVAGLKKKYDLIPAVSLEADARGIERLKNIPGVKRIYLDSVMRFSPIDEAATGKTLGTNTDTVGATYLWNYMNITGRNVTVAIVDTGIDYTHPDLGGCLGPSCKVKAGYDFVNDRADPMDDDGHGTHCAGIVAANGGIKGVAPDASLLAAKVCSPSGCLNSLAIAGIDWAVAHGANVISLSIGSSKQPNDGMEPLQMIIDAAVEHGVMVVAAAGNEGPGTGTLSDTASARDVIGVGADNDEGTVSAKDDVVANFSCRGPSAFGRSGPDIVAPGVLIYSTKLGGGYATKSGTSMAAPHVAGAAALLLEHNRSLSPQDIKSMLVHSAEDIAGHPFEKGAGLLNITRAVISGISASVDGAASWNIGAFPGMNSSAVLKIKNDRPHLVNLSVSIAGPSDLEGDFNVPADLFALPSSICLAPGEERNFDISFMPQPGLDPGTYASTLVLKNAEDSVRIPVAVTIPQVGSGTLQGSVNDACSIDSAYNCGYDPSGDVEKWGDWKFYRLVSQNATSLDLRLNWTGANSDLDLYLFAPDGVLAAVSGDADSTGEHIRLDSLNYREYWAAVYAYSIDTATLPYNLSVSYSSSMRIEPASWQAAVRKGEIATANFTVINDGVSDSNLGFDMVSLAADKAKQVTGTAQHTTANTFSIVWSKSTGGLNLSAVRYMNASLVWSNSANNLNMYFAYKNGGVWNASRFKAQHRNDLSGTGEERLDGVDIKYYLGTYSDVGIGIENTGNPQSYTLKLNFTEEAHCPYMQIDPAGLASLPPGGSQNIRVSVDTDALTPGASYEYFLLVSGNSKEYANVPVRLSILPTTTVTTSTTTSSETSSTSTSSSTSTTTTMPGPCELAGNYPPCEEVTLSEVVALINQWSAGQAALSDVVALVNKWADG